MPRRALTKKEIADLKARLRSTEKIAEKPQIPTDEVALANLNLALNLADLINVPLVTLPPPILTLTPAYPTSSDGNNWLMFRTEGGRAGPLPWGYWDARGTDPEIYFPLDNTYLWFNFGTTPTRTCAAEISLSVSKPSSGALWRVDNLVDNSVTTFSPTGPWQTLTVAFKAKDGYSRLALSYVVPPNTQPPYNDEPCFYSVKLILLP